MNFVPQLGVGKGRRIQISEFDVQDTRGRVWTTVESFAMPYFVFASQNHVVNLFVLQSLPGKPPGKFKYAVQSVLELPQANTHKNKSIDCILVIDYLVENYIDNNSTFPRQVYGLRRFPVHKFVRVFS